MQQKAKITMLLILSGALLWLFFAPSFVSAYEAAPLASTLSPSFVTEKSMQLNGRVSPNEMTDTYAWFEWGVSGRQEIYETDHQHLWGGNEPIDTSATIIGLAPTTQYFYRQMVENGRGKDAGQVMYITTKALPSSLSLVAIIATNDAIFVSDTTATLRGYVSPHGNANTRTWFEWGTSATMENQTGTQWGWGDSGPTETTLQYLMPGTRYYFRAVAENAQGRSYGAMKTFLTAGIARATETPRDQNIPSPVVLRTGTISHSVTVGGVVNVPSADANGLPQARNRPGDFFSILFGARNNTSQTSESNNSTDGVTAEAQVAGAAAASPRSDKDSASFFAGNKAVEVVVEKVGPKNVVAHTPVEYRVGYLYLQNISASDATLSITLPKDVVYIGDNTNNELLLETNLHERGGASQTAALLERTYILPVGHMENGSTRTISVLGMTTGDAQGFPDVAVRLKYTDKDGAHIVAGVLLGAAEQKQNSARVADVAGTQNKFLPNSLVGWIIYILVVVAAIVGIRKAKEYYVDRKEILLRVEEEGNQLSQSPQPLPGSEEVTPRNT